MSVSQIKAKHETTNNTSKATHGEHSRSRMHLAFHIWCVKDTIMPTEGVMPVLHKAYIDAAMIAAKASQIKEQAGPVSIEKAEAEGTITVDTSCSVSDIHVWLSEIRVDGDDQKRKKHTFPI